LTPFCNSSFTHNPNRSVEADGSYKGLVQGKKIWIVTAPGGSYPKDTPYSAYDRQEPYLRLIFAFMGITDIEAIHADSLMGGEETRSQDLAHAQAALQAAGAR
jgi:FMN-dependent NADH-azoreductase